MQLKRRTLLSGLAASAAVPFMSAAHAKQAGAGTKWDKETDVLVIGYGGAGACVGRAHPRGYCPRPADAARCTRGRH